MEKYRREQHQSDVESKIDESFPEDLLEKRDIVVLGETAHGKHYRTILRFLETFGPQLNQIFLELPVDYQDSVDRYFSTGKVDEALEGLFVGSEKEGKNVRGLLKIFDKAKEMGKAIRCFDSSKTKTEEYQMKSKRGRYFLRGESRDEDMLENVQRQYEQEPGKYLLIVGANHSQEGKTPDGGERLGAGLKRIFGKKYASFELRKERSNL
jgi:hypothetical protein